MRTMDMGPRENLPISSSASAPNPEHDKRQFETVEVGILRRAQAERVSCYR